MVKGGGGLSILKLRGGTNTSAAFIPFSIPPPVLFYYVILIRTVVSGFLYEIAYDPKLRDARSASRVLRTSGAGRRSYFVCENNTGGGGRILLNGLP